jgi:hypothetical protein
MEILYLPECAREECEKPKRSKSKYCSEFCGVKVATTKLYGVISLLPVKKSKTIDALPSSFKQRKEALRKLIRALEKRQKLIDGAVITHTDDSYCGYDFRITTEWLVDLDIESYMNTDIEPKEIEVDTTKPEDYKEDIENTGDSVMVNESTAEKTGSELKANNDEHICKADGRCQRHEGWQYIKPRELEVLINEYVTCC